MTLTISKKADKDCKLVVETSQHLNLFPESVSKLICSYICYHFFKFQDILFYTLINQAENSASLLQYLLQTPTE